MEIQQGIKEFLIEIEVRKYTPRTIRGYRNNLNLFLRFCTEHEIATIENVTLATVKQFTRAMTASKKKGTYINGILKGVKSFLQYCYEEGYGAFNTKCCFPWCKEERAVITAFTPQQVKTMFQNCRGGDFKAIRDRTILTMLIDTGIRCLELCSIRPSDIHEDYIIIQGKNHKQRVVPITPILRKNMVKYEAVKESYFRYKNTDDTYFLSFHENDNTEVKKCLEKFIPLKNAGLSFIYAHHTGKGGKSNNPLEDGCGASCHGRVVDFAFGLKGSNEKGFKAILRGREDNAEIPMYRDEYGFFNYDPASDDTISKMSEEQKRALEEWLDGKEKQVKSIPKSIGKFNSKELRAAGFCVEKVDSNLKIRSRKKNRTSTNTGTVLEWSNLHFYDAYILRYCHNRSERREQ